jgi:hypothetical protein
LLLRRYKREIGIKLHTFCSIISNKKEVFMKRLLIIFLSLGLAVGASAQRYGHGGGSYGHGGFYRPRVSIGVGVGAYSPFAPYYGYGYPYYGYPPAYSVVSPRLEMKIQDIRADYQDRIRSARHDRSLSHKERKNEIRQLKLDRDEAIMQAKRDYYNNRRY